MGNAISLDSVHVPVFKKKFNLIFNDFLVHFNY